MLLCGEEGPFVDRFQRGEFSDTEIATLVGLFGSVLGPADVPDALRTSPSYVAGRRAITTLNTIFGALPIWAMFDASVRIFATFGKERVNNSNACDALAFDANDVLHSTEPTFGIHVNLDSLPVLHETANVLLRDALPAIVREVMPQPPAGRDVIAFLTDTGTFHATLLILLHELGHILRGHLRLIASVRMSEGVD